MLSAHQPFETFPPADQGSGAKAGGTAQVAGGVPAMCDGVTQGQPGMELSLFSRDVIAMATASACPQHVRRRRLSRRLRQDRAGLIIGALTFGHLPAVFVPAGPMTSACQRREVAVRQLYAEGKVGRAELLEAEAKSYHGPAPAPSTAPPIPTRC
jgi:phosphogluconate dehydratase